MGAALALDEARLAKLRDQVLEVGEGQALALGDSAERNGRSPAWRPSSTIRRTPYSARVEKSIGRNPSEVVGLASSSGRRRAWRRGTPRRSCGPPPRRGGARCRRRSRLRPGPGRSPRPSGRPASRGGPWGRGVRSTNPSSSSSSTSRPTTCLWRPARRASSVALTPSSSRNATTGLWRGRRSRCPRSLRPWKSSCWVDASSLAARTARSGAQRCRSPRPLMVVTIKTVTNKNCIDT